MSMTFEERQRYTASDIARAKKHSREAELRREQAATRVEDHVRATRSRLFGVQTAANLSYPTAYAWIGRAGDWPRSAEEFLDETRAREITTWLDQHLAATVKAIFQHVDETYAALAGQPAHTVPVSIAQLPAPSWAVRRRR